MRERRNKLKEKDKRMKKVNNKIKLKKDFKAERRNKY